MGKEVHVVDRTRTRLQFNMCLDPLCLVRNTQALYASTIGALVVTRMKCTPRLRISITSAF